MSEQPRQWLTLSLASRLLGVHPTTLRNWADNGQIPCYRTPGGHRRFDAVELRAFLTRANAELPQVRSGEGSPAIVEAVLTQTRTELDRAPPRSHFWYEAFDEQGREHQRQLGRQLFTLAIQFITHPRRQEVLLPQGRRLGTAYAVSSLRYNISLLESVRAFQYFRQALLQALHVELADTHRTDAEDLRICQDLDTVLNEVLYGLIDTYEQKLLGHTLSNPQAIQAPK